MAFCSKCGAALKENDAFCYSCGCKVESRDTGPAQSGSPAPQPGASAQTSPLQKYFKPALIILLAAILICVLVFLLRPSQEPSGGNQPGSDATASPGLTESTAPVSQEPDQQPAAGQGISYSNELFSLTLPSSWADCYTVSESNVGDARFFAFNEVNNAEAGFGGRLFTIGCYPFGAEDMWYELPSYDEIGESFSGKFIALYPTDVQYDSTDGTLTDMYKTLADDVPDILRGISFPQD